MTPGVYLALSIAVLFGIGTLIFALTTAPKGEQRARRPATQPPPEPVMRYVRFVNVLAAISCTVAGMIVGLTGNYSLGTWLLAIAVLNGLSADRQS